MTILGVDPGVNHLGYGLVEETGNRFRVLSHGRITPSRSATYPEKLEYLHRRLSDAVRNLRPDVLAIEEIYVGENVRVALKIGQVMGLVIAVGLKEGIPFVLIPPRDIKKTVVGTGAASKEQVRFMVEQLTGVRDIRDFDESDAIAAAISFTAMKALHVSLHPRDTR